ncbi:MAG: hypothetical protein P1R58_04940 [bacterium]|nr:hypothetical protein [bacterium]
MQAILERERTEDLTSTSMVGLSETQRLQGLMLQRMETVRRLSEGCFHRMRSELSVLMGQLELADQLRSSNGKQSESEFHPIQISKIASGLADNIETLSGVQQLASGSVGRLSAQEAADRLESMLSGMDRWVRDSRGVSIDILSGPHSGPDFPIETELIIDFLFPLLIEMMSEAVSSGLIKVRGINRDNRRAIQVEFCCSLVSHVDLQQTLSNSCRYTADVREGNLYSHLDSCAVIGKYYRKEGGECVVEFFHA